MASAPRVVGEGILTPQEVAPLESLLPSVFSWMTRMFTSRSVMLVGGRGEGQGITMGARLSSLPDIDSADVIAKASGQHSG